MAHNGAQLGLENLASSSDQRQGVLRCPRAVVGWDHQREKGAGTSTKASQIRYLMLCFLYLETSKNL